MLKERSNFKWFHKTIIKERATIAAGSNDTKDNGNNNEMSSGAAASGGSPGGVRGCGAPAREAGGPGSFLFRRSSIPLRQQKLRLCVTDCDSLRVVSSVSQFTPKSRAKVRRCQ